MDTHTVLVQLVLILLFSRIGGELAAWFRIPAVIGELVAGLLLGPSLFGLVDMSQMLTLLSQIGVILLLFEVGLEADMGKLVAVGGRAGLVALGGVIFPFILGFWLSYYIFSFSFLLSLFIGSALTATSIGITLRVFKDLKKQDSLESQVILGAAILGDIIGVVLLAMLYEFASVGGVSLLSAGKVFLFIALFFVMAPLAVKLISYLLQKWDEKSSIPGLIPASIVALILFFSYIAKSLGAPELLGGFAAGLALSRKFNVLPFLGKGKDFSRRIETQMSPIVHLFAPIFFISIGISLDLSSIAWGSSCIWLLTGGLTLAALIGKLCSGFLLYKESKLRQLVIGIAMVPRGEIGLIFTSVGLSTGILSGDVYAALVLVIMITTLLASIALRFIYAKNSKF